MILSCIFYIITYIIITHFFKHKCQHVITWSRAWTCQKKNVFVLTIIIILDFYQSYDITLGVPIDSLNNFLWIFFWLHVNIKCDGEISKNGLATKLNVFFLRNNKRHFVFVKRNSVKKIFVIIEKQNKKCGFDRCLFVPTRIFQTYYARMVLNIILWQ